MRLPRFLGVVIVSSTLITGCGSGGSAGLSEPKARQAAEEWLRSIPLRDTALPAGWAYKDHQVALKQWGPLVQDSEFKFHADAVIACSYDLERPNLPGEPVVTEIKMVLAYEKIVKGGWQMKTGSVFDLGRFLAVPDGSIATEWPVNPGGSPATKSKDAQVGERTQAREGDLTKETALRAAEAAASQSAARLEMPSDYPAGTRLAVGGLDWRATRESPTPEEIRGRMWPAESLRTVEAMVEMRLQIPGHSDSLMLVLGRFLFCDTGTEWVVGRATYFSPDGSDKLETLSDR